MKKYFLTLVASLGFLALPVQSADYKIDTEGAHASITFEIQHLGYSWLTGRFDDFEGAFTYDPDNPDNNRVVVEIDPASINSNHAERDKHLRGGDFLDVKIHPEARFVSTEYVPTGDDTARLKGELTLRGVTQPVVIDVEHIGGGKDPWGGYRQGFRGTTEIALKDFDILYDLGPASETVKLTLDVEGIRKK